MYEGNGIAISVRHGKVTRVSVVFRYWRAGGRGCAPQIDFRGATRSMILRDQRFQWPFDEGRIARVAIAICEREFLGLDQQMHALGTEGGKLPDVKTFDDVQLLEN